MARNHIVDPTFFYDAIDEFSFDYPLYHISGKTIDEYGMSKNQYEQHVIRGSMQSQGKRLNQNKDGNETSWDYNFYCKSLYRIDIGDIIRYHNNYYRVGSINDYDEWGVRSASLSMVQLSAYKDLADYVQFLNGEEVV